MTDNSTKQYAKNVRQVGLRLSEEQRAVVDAACAALSSKGGSISPAQIFYTAGLEEAFALGFTTSLWPSAVRPTRGFWKHRPSRNSARHLEKKLLSITIQPLFYRAIHDSAEWVDASDQQFLLGSLYSFIAKCKLADPKNRLLQSIRLPAFASLK